MKHGQAKKGKKTPEYQIWTAMKERCYNPNCKNYKDYGGRGIEVCEHWHDFRIFFKDVGIRPDGLTLDRVDNDGDYGPDNWQWTTRKEQANNRRPMSCGPRKQRWFYGHGSSGEMIIENNQHHVARVFGLSNVCISDCLRNKLKQHRGWKFQWI